MMIKGRLLLSIATVERFQTENNLSPLEWQAPLPVRISQPYVVLEDHSDGATRPRERFDDIFIRFDTILVCDRQTRFDSKNRTSSASRR